MSLASFRQVHPIERNILPVCAVVKIVEARAAEVFGTRNHESATRRFLEHETTKADETREKRKRESARLTEPRPRSVLSAPVTDALRSSLQIRGFRVSRFRPLSWFRVPNAASSKHLHSPKHNSPPQRERNRAFIKSEQRCGILCIVKPVSEAIPEVKGGAIEDTDCDEMRTARKVDRAVLALSYGCFACPEFASSSSEDSSTASKSDA